MSAFGIDKDQADTLVRIEELLTKILAVLTDTNCYGEMGTEAIQNSIARGTRGIDTYGNR